VKDEETVGGIKIVRSPKLDDLALPDELEGGLGSLHICSFNISFVGHWPAKEYKDLAKVMKGCDIAVIQELVAPPMDVTAPDGTPIEKDDESAAFFAAMKAAGFAFELSPEDTGPGTEHTNSTATEWFVAFYDADKVAPAPTLPKGFVATPALNNAKFDRVPYAFPFKVKAGGADFVLISVHLRARKADETSIADYEATTLPAIRRELKAIFKWVDKQQETSPERDFVILGDTNLERAEDVEAVVKDRRPKKLASLNAAATPTNTSALKARPYDQVFYDLTHTKEVLPAFGVLEITKRFNAEEFSSSNQFTMAYSDHQMIYFRYRAGPDDD